MSNNTEYDSCSICSICTDDDNDRVVRIAKSVMRMHKVRRCVTCRNEFVTNSGKKKRCDICQEINYF